MKTKQEIIDSIINLINNDLDENVVDIKMLPASGSSRIYYRVLTDRHSCIATYNSNVEENNAFLMFSRHFANAGLSVPEILTVNEEKDCYIQSDLGDVSLYHYVQNCIKRIGGIDKEVLPIIKMDEPFKKLITDNVTKSTTSDKIKAITSPINQENIVSKVNS